MSSDNKNLKVAREQKFDEFYTHINEINAELSYYTENFRDRIVYCNCDDYRFSQFYKYFKNNFHSLGLKALCATNFDIGKGAFRAVYDGMNEIVEPLDGDGSFDSDECLQYLQQADIIVTNPPFSRFRDFFNLLMNNNKKFIIVGNHNAISYKSVYQYIMKDMVWMGKNRLGNFINQEGIYKRICECGWFTNLKSSCPNAPYITDYHFSEESNARYINYPAWNVNTLKTVPIDEYIDITATPAEIEEYRKTYDLKVLDNGKTRIYRPIFGVPLTFIFYYCPEQYKIIGVRYGNNGKDLGYNLPNGKYKYPFIRVLIQRRK